MQGRQGRDVFASWGGVRARGQSWWHVGANAIHARTPGAPIARNGRWPGGAYAPARTHRRRPDGPVLHMDGGPAPFWLSYPIRRADAARRRADRRRGDVAQGGATVFGTRA